MKVDLAKVRCDGTPARAESEPATASAPKRGRARPRKEETL
jgi:hypothetical protein